MSERGTVDPTRQGGTEHATKRKVGSDMISVDDALAFVDANVRWRALRVRADQALMALANEVLHQRDVIDSITRLSNAP